MSSFIFSRRFWPLFGAQTLGAFADNTLRMATIVAISAAVTGERADGFLLPFGLGEYAGSIVSMAFTLPVLLFSLISGQIADKHPRHLLIRRLKSIELILMAIAALFFALGDGLFLTITLFLMGTQSAFFSPVRNAVMPQYYHGPGELLSANGFFNGALFVAVLVGLGLGGHFIARPNGAITVSIILVIAALLGMALARFTPAAPAPGLARIRLNVFAVGLEQISELRKLRGLSYPILGIAWFWMIGAILLAILPNYVQSDLGGSAADITPLQAAFAVGAGLGSVFTGLLGKFTPKPILLAGIGVLGNALGTGVVVWLTMEGATLADGITGPTMVPLLFAFMATAAFNGMFVVPLMAALQRRAPDNSRARLMGVSNMSNGALATLGALLVIPLGIAGASPTGIFALIGAVQLALFFFMLARWRALQGGDQ